MIGKNVTASHREGEGWFTSSYSNSTGSCVEVKLGVDATLVRDSKDRRVGQPVLCISRQSWSSFLDAVEHL